MEVKRLISITLNSPGVGGGAGVVVVVVGRGFTEGQQTRMREPLLR